MKKPPLALMLLLVCIGSFGAVLYTPALPTIAHHFNISDRLAELSMGLYLFGYAIAQIPYGPICNRFGRKNALYAGLSLAGFAAILSVASAYTSYTMFLISRLLFALGAASGVQVIYTMIGDLYKPPKSVKIASYMTLAFAMSPSVSTTIGGFLTEYIHWQSCFYFLAGYCFILLGCVRLLPETLVEKDLKALYVGNVIRGYKALIQDHKIMYVAAIIGAAIAFNYTFATMAPALVIEQLRVSPSIYGLLNNIPSAALVIGAILANILSHTMRAMRLILYAVLLTIFGVVLLLAGFIYTPTLYTLFIPYALVMLAQPMLEANAICLALHYHKNKSTTSAIINFVSLAMCMGGSLIGSSMGTGSPINMPLIFGVLSLSILVLYFGLRKVYFSEH